MAAVLTLSPTLTCDLPSASRAAVNVRKRRFFVATPPLSPSRLHDFKRVKMESVKPKDTPVEAREEVDSPRSTAGEATISSMPPPDLPQQSGNKPGKKSTDKKAQTLSEYVLACMANYGLCVLDNFMGEEKATQILNDVAELDDSGVLVTGQTVQKQDEVKNVRKVRQDRIAFVKKNKSQGMDDLVSKLDSLLTKVQFKSKTDPRYTGKKLFDVSGRTRAMVSCYPGNGTHYVRHVDNHHKDGRCITVVYYLNKDWDVKTHGGVLKVYPQLVDSKVAKIEPKIDRVLLFWSDERNPHEVLPAFRKRYAITVWYFDRQERRNALAKHQALGEGSALVPGSPSSNVRQESKQ